MKINNNMIGKLSELSMIEIHDNEKEMINHELEELIEKLEVVSNIKIKESEAYEKKIYENKNKDRKKKNIEISHINDYIVDNYVVIDRMVGED